MAGGDDKQRIRERAYELWEREGRPHGRHMDHWVQAEQETQDGQRPEGSGRPGGDAGLFGEEPGGAGTQRGGQPSGGSERGFGAAGDPDRVERVAERIPMGRVGEPDEVAGAIEWLLGPDAGYVSGAVIRIAGGF